MNDKSVFTEVISICPLDSSIIEQCGANRIQLVSALQIGGVTPSPTIIRKSLQAASIPTNIIIRHHNNGFFYSQNDKNLMLDEIISCKQQYKPAGIVVGSLQKQSDNVQVDVQFVQEVIKQIGGKMTATFHKASDFVTQFDKGVQTILKSQFSEILTQAGVKPILNQSNTVNILKLSQNIRENNILCGGGINHSNKKEIIQKWGVKRIHIGTCVRKEKYGLVCKDKLMEFMKI